MSWKLYIIRHCQPDPTTVLYQKSNYVLSDIGKEQATYVAKQMKEWGIDQLYSSALARTIETAYPIQQETNTPWHIWPALSEVPSRGGWPKLRVAGLNNSDFTELVMEHQAQKEMYPNWLQQKEVIFSQPFAPVNNWNCSLKETREQSYHRAELVLHHLQELYSDSSQSVAVVCHGAFGSILLTLLTNSEPCDYNRFNQAHGAISRVDFDYDWANGQYGPAIRFVNDTSHFPKLLITEGVNP